MYQDLVRLQKALEKKQEHFLVINAKPIDEAEIWAKYLLARTALPYEILKQPIESELNQHDQALWIKERPILIVQQPKNLISIDLKKLQETIFLTDLSNQSKEWQLLKNHPRGIVWDITQITPWQRLDKYVDFIIWNAQQLHLKIATGAARLLAERTLLNPFALENELKKLALFAEPTHSIDDEMVLTLCTTPKSTSCWQVAELILQKQWKEAAASAPILFGSEEPIAAFRGIRSVISRTLQLRSLKENNHTFQEVQAAFPNLRQVQLEKDLQRSGQWTIEALKNALLHLDRIDAALKSGHSEPTFLFEQWLSSIPIPPEELVYIVY